jgi:hypothetical protein
MSREAELPMVTVILDDGQASQIATAAAPVELRDRRGCVLGTLVPGFTPEDISRAKTAVQDSDRRMTTSELLEHLGSLPRS